MAKCRPSIVQVSIKYGPTGSQRGAHVWDPMPLGISPIKKYPMEQQQHSTARGHGTRDDDRIQHLEHNARRIAVATVIIIIIIIICLSPFMQVSCKYHPKSVVQVSFKCRQSVVQVSIKCYPSVTQAPYKCRVSPIRLLQTPMKSTRKS